MNKDIRNILVAIVSAFILILVIGPVIVGTQNTNYSQVSEETVEHEAINEIDDDELIDVDYEEDVNYEESEVEKEKTVNEKNDTDIDSIDETTDTAEYIAYEVKEYILNGQPEHLSSAEMCSWNPTYLEALSEEIINGIYSKFLESGGNEDNIREFAEYLTANAPVYPNWKEDYERDFYNDEYYGTETIIGYEYIDDDPYRPLYAVYVEGFEGVFQYVCPRTGWAHG